VRQATQVQGGHGDLYEDRHRSARERRASALVVRGTRQLFGCGRRELLSWIRGERAGSPGVKLFGPFKTDAEVRESERLTLLGPQCKVTGVIHPAPARLQ
jgi:hypothetical protein